jgi:predicted peroxiredoxin
MNNTIVVGSLATSLILALPLFFASMRGVRLYRERWREKVQNSKFVKVLKATPFYGLYDKYEKAKAKFGIIS